MTKTGSIQQHILYLGHQDLFNLKNSPAKIFLTIITEEENNLGNNLLVDKNNVVWEYNWKYDDKGKEIRNSLVNLCLDVQEAINDNDSDIDDREKKNNSCFIQQDNPEKKIEKSKVNGIENHWIRCRFQPSDDKWNFTKIGRIESLQ